MISIYLGGIILSLMIWSTIEGFGGPYGPGSSSTDIGAAIMYAFIFVAIIIVERSSNYSRYSLDALIERKFNGWKHLAEFYDEKKSSSKRLSGFQTACKAILPKVDPMLVQDMALRQQQNPQEQPMYTVEVFSEGSRSPEVVKDILADTGMVPSVYEHYVVNHKTTLGTLERIQKYPDV